MRNWLLPEYIEDVLPEDALRIESMRRALLDFFRVHGYQLVMPPMLEYVESLLSGTGHDLDLATFKLVDQLSGRHMGVRADITPQVARIDAHLLNRLGVTRLCYAGSVLHARPAGLTKSREPFQVGAELYGHAGLESDLEIQQLTIDALKLIGVNKVRLDIGHPAIFRALLREAACTEEQAEELFHAVQAKDVPALNDLTRDLGALRPALLALPTLYGDAQVLKRARDALPTVPAVLAALADLERVMALFADKGVAAGIDLAELGGFNYESGMVFAAYAHGSPDAVARGGRYDEIGKTFGRARPATGFSLDLKPLLELLPRQALPAGILAPAQGGDARLAETIAALRKAGEIVIQELPGHAAQRAESGCNRTLIKVSGEWQVVPLAP
jgi:ATP phosphoribosyltransferase regulatory subunit